MGAILIKSADMVLDLWDGIVAWLSAIVSFLDVILNPVLSPIFSILNPPSNFIGDIVYAMLSPLPVWLGITFISVFTGVVMLVAFRYTSNQEAIGRAKDDIKAHLLALKLYKDEIRVVFQSQVRLLGAICRLQRYVLTPVLVMLLPMLLGLAQMGIRYQWRPVRPGEPIVIKALLHRNVSNPQPIEVELDAGSGVVVEVGPVPGNEEWVWRIHAIQTGQHTLIFHVDGKKIIKQLIVSEGFEKTSALRPSKQWVDQLLHPVEAALDSDSPIQSIEILYPTVDSLVYGADYWIVYYFIVSMAAALIFKPVFNVRF